jgi:hypothetical protein
LQISKEKLNQVFNISGQGTHDPEQRVLSIRLGECHFGFAISNAHTNELLQLTWYTGDDTNCNELDEISAKHPELRDFYAETMISYDHPRSILVPPGSYTDTDPQILLNTMFGSNGKDTILKDAIPSWQLLNVYAVPSDIKDWMQRHFPEAEYRHSYSIGIRQINTTDFEGGLLIDFRTGDFTLVASKASRLLLVQTFPYATPDDVLYYLVKVCQELSFNQETVRVALSGLIEKESNLFRELDQFFLHIRFRDTAWKIRATAGEEYPHHFFTSLNDVALCAS